ncbi:MAG: hypothetical protein IIB56_16540 [Planctomycetes bacterium]|nr:hypothetical protein [Planctomycetota bacterium]
MDALDYVAIIGAAAWTPQIITWVYRILTQPKVSIHLHSLPQIGYTTLGPIFNVTFALLSEKKDAILNKISATLKHESGATYTFDWAGLSEDLSEIENPIGETVSVKKTSLPLVVKVLHTGVAQVFVRFQHKQFKVNLRKPGALVLDRFIFLKSSGKLKTEQDIEDLVSEQVFSEYMKHLSSEFIWIAGKYTVTFAFGSPNKFKYKKNEYIFELSQDDINELKKNIDNIKHDLIEAGKIDIISNYEMKKINWIWRSPELRKKEYTK